MLVSPLRLDFNCTPMTLTGNIFLSVWLAKTNDRKHLWDQEDQAHNFDIPVIHQSFRISKQITCGQRQGLASCVVMKERESIACSHSCYCASETQT